MSEPRIPTIDLRPWLSGDPQVRRETAATVDAALRAAGFLLVTGHGVDPALRTAIRDAARGFFGLPAAVKEPYAVKVGGRGWLGPGAEANGRAEGTQTPPDLKESLSFAAEDPTGDPVIDAEWFLPNTWPREAPELRALVTEYLTQMRTLSDRLLELLGAALGEPEDFFTRHTTHPTWGFNINWYPGTEVVGEPAPGQFRIGPHTDFGGPRPAGRQGRAADLHGRRRLGGRPVRPRGLHHQHRRPDGTLDGRPLALGPAPGAAAALRRPRRGADVARLFL